MQNTKYSLYLYFHLHLYLYSAFVSSGPPPSRRVWVNFAELQKGCKIVLARRAPYLRVVTNDKYCTSYLSSCKRSPKPDQRLYSTTARVCLSATLCRAQIVGLFIYSELLACSKGPNYSNLRTFSLHSTGISKNINSELEISPTIINSKSCELGTGFQACDLPKRQAVVMNQSITFLKNAKDRLKNFL